MDSRRLLLKRSAVAACALFFLEGTAFSAQVDPTVIEELSKAAPGERVAVIIKFRDSRIESPIAATRHERRRKIVSALKSRMRDSVNTVSHLIANKGAIHRDLWIINAVALKADAKMVEAFSNTPRVESITLDAVLSAPGVSYGVPAEPEWNLSMTGAPGLWSIGMTGENVIVATMDTGADLNHPDLGPSWRGGTNSWYDPYGEHTTPYDADGHGTMVAGIITGGASGGTSIGMAPNARWIGVKIFNDSGSAYLSSIHQGFQWLLDPDGDPSTDDAPQVVNGSWGLGNTGGCSAEFESDLQVLNEAGIGAVFAAGNYGPNQYTSVSPANSLLSVSAGAVDYTGNIAGFSSQGPSACDGAAIYPFLTAPGVDVRTSDLTYGGSMPQSYSVVSGTSFAAAHVSGALALLSGAFPEASPSDLVSALQTSSHDLGQSGADNVYGAGLIQLKPAYDILAEKFSAPQPGPVITDQDNDGYAEGSDCNDTDQSVHPGAKEIKYDGIDQDCNGYDLTINITRATYSDTYKSLRVEATSSLGADAALAVEGFGPMSWSANLRKWVLTVRGAQKPAEVAVSGVEGSEVFVFEQTPPQPVPEPTPQPEPQPDPAPTTDQDSDGYASGADCNDSDPAVHPGAAEVIYDGIDQDCNGFDLTTKVTRATYSSAYKSLRVEATSSLGANAALEVEGFGAMSWSPNLRKWVLTVRIAQKPAEIAVTGVEGTVRAGVN